MIAHRLVQRVGQDGAGLILRPGAGEGFEHLHAARQTEELEGAPRPFFVDREAGSRGQGAYLFVERERLRNMPPQEETGLAGGIGAGLNFARRDQGLDLRSKPEPAAVVGDVERLDAERVARQKQPAAQLIP